MQCELLSEFPRTVLPLPCNGYISVTSLWLHHRVIDTAVRQWRIHVGAHAFVKVKGGHLSCRHL